MLRWRRLEARCGEKVESGIRDSLVRMRRAMQSFYHKNSLSQVCDNEGDLISQSEVEVS